MSRERILLVEDIEDNRELAREVLESAGFDVVEAIDGQQAIEFARRLPFDLILLDMSLPVVDGWETLRRMKADPILAKVPVIAVTAHAMVEDQKRALAGGCLAYFTKPISVSTFSKDIAGLLEAHP